MSKSKTDLINKIIELYTIGSIGCETKNEILKLVLKLSEDKKSQAGLFDKAK